MFIYRLMNTFTTLVYLDKVCKVISCRLQKIMKIQTLSFLHRTQTVSNRIHKLFFFIQ